MNPSVLTVLILLAMLANFQLAQRAKFPSQRWANVGSVVLVVVQFALLGLFLWVVLDRPLWDGY